MITPLEPNKSQKIRIKDLLAMVAAQARRDEIIHTAMFSSKVERKRTECVSNAKRKDLIARLENFFRIKDPMI